MPHTAPDTLVSQVVWKQSIHTDLCHTAEDKPVCQALCNTTKLHACVLGRVPIRGYIDLYHTASHMPVCETVWSILTSIQFQH
ncbi:tRNA-specific 2-thiouridylase mnmA [Gossypium arboreum]|uniref:tRNA-specific 2-thiouridylase mnmA n=1 Tax=Gossypium arboreum TaxID=29729 RepID=A0A0B0P6T5_GOSAR|nr:tRNA-specific 2-thiouridylase mnmA [Gossypium arboreum]